MRELTQQIHIVYYRSRVEALPNVSFSKWKIRSKMEDVVSVYSNGRRTNTYRVSSKRGQELLNLKEEKENCIKILSKLESEWLARYNCPCETIKIDHYGDTENKRFFDSLKERQNSMEFKSGISYRGLPYRSKLESDFARIMEEIENVALRHYLTIKGVA